MKNPDFFALGRGLIGLIVYLYNRERKKIFKYMGNVLNLESLEIYKIARNLSELAWGIYKVLGVDDRITIRQQFLRSTDSVGANITEGYARFHFLDKVKFYYNARASLAESIHWIELLKEREIIASNEHFVFKEQAERLYIKLNAFIKFNLNKKQSNP